MADKIDNTEENRKEKKPVEVYSEKAETEAPEISQDEMKSLALAYARFLAEKDLKPGDATFIEPEELLAKNAGKSAAESRQAEAAAPENRVKAAPQTVEKAAQETRAAAAPEIKEAAISQSEEAKRKAEEMKALASEYARFLKENGMKPGEEYTKPTAEAVEPAKEKEKKSAEVSAAEAAKKEAAKKEAIRDILEETTLRYKKNPPKKKKKAPAEKQAKPAAENIEKATDENKAKPTAEEKAKAAAEEKAIAAGKKAEEKKEKEKQKQARRKAKAKAAAEKKKASGAADDTLFRTGKVEKFLAAGLDAHDRMQDRQDESFGKAGRGFIKGAHDIAATYTHSRRQIAIGLLVVGVLAAGILILFDSFTVYEYAYNGKVLGYVKEQEEVTEVLDIAGEKLTQNSGGTVPVEFVANQNVTFNPVDGRGKSTDDMDTAVNKLIYMTDIETQAYAVYDGDRVVAIVKDEASAEKLLEDSMATLSKPDSGMDLVSAEFVNELSINPVDVLLSSVQSNSKALRLMTKGGDMETLHIVEEGETLASIAEQFGVDPVNVTVYDTEGIRDSAEEESEDSEEDIDEEEGEDSEEDAEEESEDTEEIISEEESGNAVKETAPAETEENAGDVQQGDLVCIKSSVEPVMVKMVEKGKMKELIEYETIKKKSDEYYQGDTHLEQEGRNGVQIFEGTLIKVAGEVVDRKEVSTSVIREKQDKIILVGTKERPKTAPTGTYAMPLEYYTVTSEFGARWGRMHTGIDLADPTGTPIYASDGGTVIRSEYFGGYGNCVEIDHENGRVTRYGHCSALLVNVGDKVYQGQEIALVGSTGNSTGPHLHFEIILDGVQHNPREFVQF